MSIDYGMDSNEVLKQLAAAQAFPTVNMEEVERYNPGRMIDTSKFNNRSLEEMDYRLGLQGISPIENLPLGRMDFKESNIVTALAVINNTFLRPLMQKVRLRRYTPILDGRGLKRDIVCIHEGKEPPSKGNCLRSKYSIIRCQCRFSFHIFESYATIIHKGCSYPPGIYVSGCKMKPVHNCIPKQVESSITNQTNESDSDFDSTPIALPYEDEGVEDRMIRLNDFLGVYSKVLVANEDLLCGFFQQTQRLIRRHGLSNVSQITAASDMSTHEPSITNTLDSFSGADNRSVVPPKIRMKRKRADDGNDNDSDEVNDDIDNDIDVISQHI